MLFTILTATYNRAYALPQLYESLRTQTFRDFEWIIVDDGSSDGTRGLVESWHPGFPIRYSWQPNSGQHVALNRAVALACGELSYAVDSDDYLLPRALEILSNRWSELPNKERFACLTGLCARPDGKWVSAPFPSDPFDCFSYGAAMRHWRGDLSGVVRTDVWKQNPFPVFPGETFIPLGVVWAKLLNRYAARYINERLLVATYASDGLGRATRDIRWSNPRGTVLFCWTELKQWDSPPLRRIKAAINLARFAPVAAWSMLTH
jgi:glycosyltransferase involved in cell wall biosynthesis